MTIHNPQIRTTQHLDFLVSSSVERAQDQQHMDMRMGVYKDARGRLQALMMGIMSMQQVTIIFSQRIVALAAIEVREGF